jgi:hypothetical protein
VRRRVSGGRVAAAVVLALVVASCGGGDDIGLPEVDDESVEVPTDDDGGDDPGSGGDGGGDGPIPSGVDTATLRMVNLVGAAEGGITVDVVGFATDFSGEDVVYATVGYGEIATFEFPEDFDARVVRSGTDEPLSSSYTVYDDTEPGTVAVFYDTGTFTGGPDPETRREGYATVGVFAAIADPDPNRIFRPSTPDGVCLFSLGNEVPAPMATAAEGGETSGILNLPIVGDRAFHIEPGPQTITYSNAAKDVFEQGDDCSSIAFSVDVVAEEGQGVFVGFHGDSSDVRSVVYVEE